MTSSSEIKISADPLLNCPTCGLPAEITDWFILGGVPTPVEHVKLVCIRGHRSSAPATRPGEATRVDRNARSEVSVRPGEPSGAAIRTPGRLSSLGPGADLDVQVVDQGVRA
jgi:hypothetical protein